MPDNEPSGARKTFGDFAPTLVHFTDDVLFGEAWARTAELSRRDRSLITVASLVRAEAPSSSSTTSASPKRTVRPSTS